MSLLRRTACQLFFNEFLHFYPAFQPVILFKVSISYVRFLVTFVAWWKIEPAVSVLCVVEGTVDNHASIVYDVARVVMAMAQSTSGLLVMVAVMVTVATVMVIPTVFTRCQSAVLQRTVMCRGTRKHVHQLLLALIAVDLEPSGRLLVTLHSLVHYFTVICDSQHRSLQFFGTVQCNRYLQSLAHVNNVAGDTSGSILRAIGKHTLTLMHAHNPRTRELRVIAYLLYKPSYS